MLPTTLTQTLETLRANRLRSFLSMFGIGWGILSLILMTSAGEGFRIAQQQNIRQLGQHIMIIWPGRTSIQADGFQAGRKIRLEFSDYEAIRDKARVVQEVSPEIIRSDLVSRTPGNFGAFSVRGILTAYQQMRTITVARGRLLNPADEQQARQVCVIGYEVNDQLFDGIDSVGETIQIGGHPFTVVGLMPYKEMNNTYFGQDRRAIFIPYPTLRKLFPDPTLGSSPDLIDNLIAAPPRADLFEAAEQEIREILGHKNHFSPEDRDALAIWNTAKQAKMMDSLFYSMQWFLGSVGIVTLLLGAVGVINIMLVSVRERTVEIGVRKSVGARRRDILRQFFAESLAITLLAGLAGALLAWLICQGVNSLELPEMVFAGMIISPAVALTAVGSLTLVAVASAIYPAYVAASLDPIEALRFEA